MYGLSFTASLLCASATRLFASATLRDKSSGFEGPGEGEAPWGEGATGGVGIGLGVAAAGAVNVPPFFIAAILAAISALF